jgi:glycerophosphoryl diester phosphodiesterase
MKYLAFTIGLILLTSCQKDFDISNLNNNQIGIIGHGGIGIEQVYPLNCFESFYKSLALGADGVEMDVQITRDSVLVAYHDVHLETSTSGSGRIFEKTWEEIEGTYYEFPPYTEYEVARIEDLFAHIPGLSDHRVFLDCKAFSPDISPEYLQMYVNTILNLIDEFNLSGKVYVELKRLDLIELFLTTRPDLEIFFYTEKDFEIALEIVHEHQLQGFSIQVDQISKNEVQQAHDEGVMVSVYNAHTNSRNIEAVEMNVDFIQTDRLRHLIRILQ